MAERLDETQGALRGPGGNDPLTDLEIAPRTGDRPSERRGKPRISIPFPTRVRGIDTSGQGFEIDILLDNLSASGLYLRLPLSICLGAYLFTVIRLTTAPNAGAGAARVAARGVVVRTEPQPDGTCGVGVAFTRSRFL